MIKNSKLTSYLSSKSSKLANIAHIFYYTKHLDENSPEYFSVAFFSAVLFNC